MIKLNQYMTDIEKIIFNLLKENDFKFVFQFPIRCKFGYIVDFYLPKYNLIIEADGEKWHNKKRDNAKTNFLKSKGYFILRFKGNEIKETPNLVIKRINSYICERRLKEYGKSKC